MVFCDISPGVMEALRGGRLGGFTSQVIALDRNTENISQEVETDTFTSVCELFGQ